MLIGATALPPDVRRGFAPPVELEWEMGYALGSGLSPDHKGGVTARRSLAAHPAAKPELAGCQPAEQA